MVKVSARHILVTTEAECLKLKADIEGGKDFAQVAKLHSQCPSGSYCRAGLCTAGSAPDAGANDAGSVDAGCVPLTCATAGANCGAPLDGCGSALSC